MDRKVIKDKGDAFSNTAQLNNDGQNDNMSVDAFSNTAQVNNDEQNDD